jgi:hydroxylamine reductase
VCGKNANVAALQDLLIYSLIGLSEVAAEGRMHGVEDHEADVFTVKALFTTLTNVNFDEADLAGYINRSVELRERLKSWVRNASSTAQFADGPANFKPANDLNGLIEQGTKIGLKSDVYAADENIRSLQQTPR